MHIVQQTKNRPHPGIQTLHVPPDLAALVPLDAQAALALDFPEAPALELVGLVCARGEAHRADVVRARAGLGRVRAALPDARREVEARGGVRGAVPVEDELRGRARGRAVSARECEEGPGHSHPAVGHGFLVRLPVGLVQRCVSVSRQRPRTRVG